MAIFIPNVNSGIIETKPIIAQTKNRLVNLSLYVCRVFVFSIMLADFITYINILHLLGGIIYFNERINTFILPVAKPIR